MNTEIRGKFRSGKLAAAICIATFTLVGCASAPQSPEGAADVRARLSQLQADPNLANLAPMAMQEAEAAVRLAEQSTGRDVRLGAHRVYMAEKKVDIATARASTRYAEDQRARLAEQRGQSRLDARTREADAAHDAADLAQQESAELQRQLDALNAKETERGLVLTLGDLLFAFDSAQLKTGEINTLDRAMSKALRAQAEKANYTF